MSNNRTSLSNLVGDKKRVKLKNFTITKRTDEEMAAIPLVTMFKPPILMVDFPEFEKKPEPLEKKEPVVHYHRPLPTKRR